MEGITIEIVKREHSKFPRTFNCICMICPNCGAHEIEDCQNIKDNDLIHAKWNISGYKVDDWSHCHKCNCWFNDAGLIQKG